LEGVWLNLQIDVKSFAEKAFDDLDQPLGFKSIDSVQVSGPCLIRRVLSCKS
jgi:hypothetical protein